VRPGLRYLVNNYVSESDEQPSADPGPQVNQAAIVENERLASCTLCFDNGMARGATDAVIASADDGFILPRGFDQRHLAIRRYRIATDRSRVNLRRSPHYKALRLLCFLVAGDRVGLNSRHQTLAFPAIIELGSWRQSSFVS
jgi:hypothetical protein